MGNLLHRLALAKSVLEVVGCLIGIVVRTFELQFK